MKNWLAALAGIVVLHAPVLAQQKEVTIGYQDMVVPYRIAQEAKELEKATGYKINWRQFGGGGEVIKAMASGAVQIGEVDQPESPPQHRAENRSSCSGFSTTLVAPRRWSSRTDQASIRSPI